MKRFQKTIALILAPLMAVSLIIACLPAIRVHAAECPSLFYNDTPWENDLRNPAAYFRVGAFDDFWIPLSLFEKLQNVKIRRSYDNNSKVLRRFTISDEGTGKSLSFEADNEYVQTERGPVIVLRTILYYKERYLPMRDVCHYFGWTFDYLRYGEDKMVVRIMDGTQTLSFTDLLAPYNLNPDTDTPDTEVTEPPETEPPVTEPPVTETTPPDVTPQPPQVVYRASRVILTFEDLDPVHTPEILDILSEYGANALFFGTGGQIAGNPELVTRILSEGHAFGLHTMSEDETGLRDTDTLLASFGEENDLLYTMTKQKTRLIRLPEGSHSGYLHLGEPQKKALSDAGYVLWDWNLAAFDNDPSYTADMVFEKLERGFRNSFQPVIRFHCTETAAEVLPSILELVSSVPTMEIHPVTEATEPIVFP